MLVKETTGRPFVRAICCSVDKVDDRVGPSVVLADTVIALRCGADSCLVLCICDAINTGDSVDCILDPSIAGRNETISRRVFSWSPGK